MMIHTSVALRKVKVMGIEIVCNTQAAKEIQKKYPAAEVHRARTKRKTKVGHQPGYCVNVPVAVYLSKQATT